MTTLGRDIKPLDYRHSCTVKQQIAYSTVDGSKGNQASVGVLQVGRVVWLDHQLEEAVGETKVRAYVDGIGMIRVDSSSLSAVC